MSREKKNKILFWQKTKPKHSDVFSYFPTNVRQFCVLNNGFPFFLASLKIGCCCCCCCLTKCHFPDVITIRSGDFFPCLHAPRYVIWRLSFSLFWRIIYKFYRFFFWFPEKKFSAHSFAAVWLAACLHVCFSVHWACNSVLAKLLSGISVFFRCCWLFI